MGNGFDEFMKNPYYKGMYENAPTEKLKRYFELSWDTSSAVIDDDHDTRKEDEEIRSLHLSREEVEYLASFAVGGAEKAAYRKWLAQFDKQ